MSYSKGSPLLVGFGGITDACVSTDVFAAADSARLRSRDAVLKQTLYLSLFKRAGGKQLFFMSSKEEVKQKALKV